MMTDDRASLHAACKVERQQRLYEATAKPPLQHVCPCCGETFVTRADRDIYCSFRCRRGMRKYDLGPLSVMALEERNRVAGLLALLKAYNQRVNTAPRA